MTASTPIATSDAPFCSRMRAASAPAMSAGLLLPVILERVFAGRVKVWQPLTVCYEPWAQHKKESFDSGRWKYK